MKKASGDGDPCLILSENVSVSEDFGPFIKTEPRTARMKLFTIAIPDIEQEVAFDRGAGKKLGIDLGLIKS